MKRKTLTAVQMRRIITLGTILATEPDWLRLDVALLQRHVFIAGGTGNGKTMLLILLMRQLASYGIGFTFVTPHPDGREKLLHALALSNVDPARIVDCKPGPDCCLSIDPFAHPPRDANPIELESWLRATVGRVVSAILRNVPLVEQEVMNRLKRWLKNVIYCCGKDVDGHHLGLAKALILLDPNHPEFDPIMDRLWPHLPDEIRSDFHNLRATRNARQREQWVESTINRLREILESPLVRQMFAQLAPGVDDEEIILKSKIQIVSVPESDYLSRDQGNVIAGLRLSAMMAAAKRLTDRRDEANLVLHFLIVDEAENFVGEDLRTGFQELRKFRMPIVIVVQDISCLLKGKMDLLSKVASQCGLQMTFQQQDPDSIEYLAKALGYAFLDLTPLLTKQVLPTGYALIQTQGLAFNSNEGISASEARSMTQTKSFTHQKHSGESIQNSVSLALSETHSEGRSESATEGGSTGVSTGTNWSKGQSRSTSVTESESEGHTNQRTRTHSSGNGESSTEAHNSGHSRQSGTSASETHRNHELTSDARSHSHGESRSNGLSSSRGRSRTTSESDGVTEGTTRTQGRSVSEGLTESESVGGSETKSNESNWSQSQGRNWSDATGKTTTEGTSTGKSWGESEGRSEGQSVGDTAGISATQTSGVALSFNQVPLQLQSIDDVRTGHLVTSVQDQLASVMQRLASLPDRMVLVKCRGMGFPFILRVHEVVDPYVQRKLFRCAAWRADDLRRYVARIRKAHSCYFLPSFEESAQNIPDTPATVERNGKPRKRVVQVPTDDPMP